MKRLGTLWLFCFLLLASSAWACSCLAGTPPCQGYWEAAAVFEGAVTQISFLPVERKLGEQIVSYSRMLIHFTVEKGYKGVSDAEVEVTTGRGGGDCGYPFRRGERYLVYAVPDQQTKRLDTSICMLTKPLADAGPDLAYIRTTATEPAGTRLYGKVLDYTPSRHGTQPSHEGLAGADIELTGPGGVRHVMSDHLGRYEWKNLSTGSYRIGASLSNYISLPPREIEFELPGHGCFAFTLLLQSNGQISGHVYDEHGTPLKNQQVELMDPEGNGLGELRAGTDEEGRYQFTGVRPGDFFIGVNISGPPDNKHPYLRTFLPGTQKRESATLVHLDKAEQLTGQDIYLGIQCEPRTVQGVALWPDGRPATNATIMLAYPDYPWRSDSQPGPDGQGRFSVQVLTQLRTTLWVQAPNSKGVWMNAGQVDLPTEGTIKPLILILNQEPPKWTPPH